MPPKAWNIKNVFVVGVEEELFPSSMSTGSEDGIEEERRLFYVAITRAEENCVLTYSKVECVMDRIIKLIQVDF